MSALATAAASAALAVVAGCAPKGAEPVVDVQVISADRVLIAGKEVTLAGYEHKLHQIAESNPNSYISLKMVGHMSQGDWDRMKAAIPANHLSGGATSTPVNLETGNLTSLPELNTWVGKAK